MTISSKPALAISTPETGSNTLSPIKLNASSTPFRGRQITGWYVYLDNVAAYHSGPMNSVDVNVAADPGLHTLLVRCWDTSGAYGDQAISIAVEKVAVNVSTRTFSNRFEITCQRFPPSTKGWAPNSSRMGDGGSGSRLTIDHPLPWNVVQELGQS